MDNAGASGASPNTLGIGDGVVDSVGNRWYLRAKRNRTPGAVANDGVSLLFLDCPILNTALTSSDSITIPFSTSVTAKVYAFGQIDAAPGSYPEAIASAGGASGASTTPSVSSASVPTGTMVIGLMGAEHGDGTITPDSDTTRGSWSTHQTAAVGTTTAGVECSMQSKVTSGGAGTQTFNQTITSTDWTTTVRTYAETTLTAKNDADTGAAVDAGESLANTNTDADTGAAVDAGSIAAMLTDDDTAGGTDAGESIAATLTDDDIGTGVDAGETVGVRVDVNDADTGAGTDAGESIAVALTDADTGTGADAGSIAAAVTDGDTGTAVDTESLEVPEPPAPPPARRSVQGGAQFDLPAGMGQRFESIRFEILNPDLSYAFTAEMVDRDSPPNIHFESRADVNRTMSGIRFGPADAARIDPLYHLCMPRWELDDGSLYNMGVFHFADTPIEVSSWGNVFVPECYDSSVILNQPRRGSFDIGVGTLLTTAARQLIDEVGLTARAGVDASSAFAVAPQLFPSGSTRKAILSWLCDAMGFYPPFFDNDGFLRLKAVPNPLSDAPPDVTYTLDANSRILKGSITVSSNINDAPNVYRVIGSPFAGVEVVGEFVVPDSAPHSRARRRIEIVREEQNQAVHDSPAADAAAQALYANDWSTYVRVEFDTPPDPRADGNQIAQLLGTNYREQSWDLTCTNGGRMHHVVQEVWQP